MIGAVLHDVPDSWMFIEDMIWHRRPSSHLLGYADKRLTCSALHGTIINMSFYERFI
jgi:hypothetical protein